MTKPFWTTWKKVALAILLGFLVSWLFGCSYPKVNSTSGDTTVRYVEGEYAAFNTMFFDGKLPKDVTLDLNNTNPEHMADTICHPDGTACRISFNPDYVKAEKVADLVELHEMCHVKTWTKIVPEGMETVDQVAHGPEWAACMADLNAQGAFTLILIDVDAHRAILRSREKP